MSWSKIKTLRSLLKSSTINDGNRTLLESVLVPEVAEALEEWINNSRSNGVLIGGLALSFYVKPRTTQDIDILFLTPGDIPTKVLGFKRTRKGAFQHNKTHAEIEVVVPATINISEQLAQKIFATAIEHDGIKIASPAGIVATKLGRSIIRDEADIVDLIKTKRVTDLNSFNLSTKLMSKFAKLEQRAKHE